MIYFLIASIVVNIVLMIFLVNKSQTRRSFEAILHSMKQIILLLDKDNYLVFYNDYAKEVLGLRLSDLNTKPSSIFSTKILEGASFDGSSEITYQDKIYSVNMYKVENSLVKQIEKVVILNNVTQERKIAETKKDFFAYSSHELKSPLTAIIGYSELMTLKMVESEEHEDLIKRIHSQAMQMLLLVEDMSTLSRLESVNESLELHENHNLKNILEATLYSQEQFIKEKAIIINSNIEDVFLYCLKLDLNKLFKNLIENAIKYSNSGSAIDITLRNNASKIEFIIKDYGIGISKENESRVFERFYRVDKGRVSPGSGLGLAIVKHIVIKYGGTIKLDSKLGSGTEIKITF